MPPKEKTYLANIDGLIDHCQDVFNEHEAEMVVNLIEWRRIRREIRREYKQRSEYGNAEELKALLAIKYFGSIKPLSTVKEILERSDEAYYKKHPVKC